MTLVSAIVVAGGTGVRMNSHIPKQYLPLGNMPILAHTLNAIARCPLIEKMYVVVPEADFEYCEKNILSFMDRRVFVRWVPGGRTRQESVFHGLTAMDDKRGIVLIHDGVRPFVTQAQILQCITEAQTHGACILGIPLQDTVKACDVENNISYTIARANLWRAQTPQAFYLEWLYEAHEHAVSQGIEATDDAYLLEVLGKRIKIIRGSVRNIKITTPEDLALAEALLRVPEQPIL